MIIKIIIIIISLIGNFLLFLPKAMALEPSDIVFTEMMYDLDGSDEDREWVEIFNQGAESITIITGSGENSWRFNDGSNHLISLFQGSETITGQGLAILAATGQTFLNEHPAFSGTIFDTTMNLNNTSDTIKLSADAGQTFFSEVTYDSSWGAAGNGKTLEKIDFFGSEARENWQESFILGGTPGQSSSTEPPNQPPIAEAGADQNVYLDQTVFFDGSLSVDPDNDLLTYFWDFGDNTNAPGVTTTHSYLATGTFVVILTVSDGELEDQDNLTINVSPPANQSPIAEAGPDQTGQINQTLIFNGSSSFDPDGDEISFIWDFGNNQTAAGVIANHSFSTSGSHLVTLYVSDGLATSTDSLLVNINAISPPSGGGGSYTGGNSQDYSNIYLNELLPNPLGSDEGEWFELFNSGLLAINLSGLKIQDNSATIFTINNDDFPNTMINPNGYFVIERSVSKIALNNTGGDCVKLLSPANILIKSICYSGTAGEGQSYARKNDNAWAWTTILTKGSQNQFSPVNPNQLLAPVGITATATVSNSSLDEEQNDNYLINSPAEMQIFNQEGLITNISFAQVKALAKGQKVLVQGVVTALPGMIGKNYFYVSEYNPETKEVIYEEGLQIFSSKNLFPQLNLGELVQINGELSESQGEKRLKIKNKTDIIIISKLKISDPVAISIGDINEEMLSGLVKIEGEILDKQNNYLILSDESGELKIYLNKGLNVNFSEVKEGFQIAVVGIIRKNKDNLRLVPRTNTDLLLGEVFSSDNNLEKKQDFSTEPIVINQRKDNLKNYLLASLGFFILVLLIIIFRAKMKNSLN